ncbi:SET domain protein [Ancylostoma caninum]|uniref:SET domain protein n=1 Tax=Ancylostoma caninum TaxID=29170 RepID=A0A368GZP9_ANCCA|nr:SET domain protein [Ancylostoma caninum]
MRNDLSAGDSVQSLSEAGAFVSDTELGDELYDDGGLELICEDDQLKSDSQPSLPKDAANGEGPSSSSSNSRPASPSRLPWKRTKRDISLIRNRNAGRVGTHTLPEVCFVCGKNGDLLHCGKKYAPGALCSTKFHKECIENETCLTHVLMISFKLYNAAEYSVDCVRKIVDETFCPLHFCSSCYLERWKTTAVRGKLVECDSCFRAFHEQCSPAGFESYEDLVVARTKEGVAIEVKQLFTRCHSHCDLKSVPLVANARSHLPFCCECEFNGEEALMKCSQCVRSFHESCLTLNCRDLEIASSPTSLCESCILGENLRVGQAVIARFRASFYAATVASLTEYPKHCADKDKFGKHLGEPGYVCVRWAGCTNMFALLPARSIVPMFGGSYSLIGKRLSEAPCREAWQKMEDELSITRPTFDYVPEKYTKIKASNSNNETTYKFNTFQDRLLKTSVYHSSCPKPRLDACEESDSMCDCPPGDKNRCGPNSKCTNRAILQECPEACEAIQGGCNNRGVSRKEVNPAVEIREAPGKGMGAFAISDIPKGSFIAEYAGELISIKEKNRRIAEVTAHRNAEEKHYMMALDSQRIIDCKEKGNDASPNCKVETVYVVVSRTKRPNGVTVKYDKRITICTIEDVPAGTELCFNYQMTQYNIGCPLPDCKCGAPNCTGTLGSVVHEKAESDVSSNDAQKPKKKKQKRKAVSSLESPEKKKSGIRSRQSTPASSTPPLSRSPRKDQKATINGRKSMPTVTFRRSSLPSKVESGQALRPQLPRPTNRGCKVLNGLKEPTSNNIDDAKLKRALLNGEALEKISDTRSPPKNEVRKTTNGLRKTRKIAAELPSVNLIVS